MKENADPVSDEPGDTNGFRRTNSVASKGESLLVRAQRLADALVGVLEEERQALGVAEPGALVVLARRKQHLLDALEALQPDLGELLERLAADDPDRQRLLERLVRCHDSNRENGMIAATGLQNARSTLSMLRDTLSLDDLTLYDRRGALETRRERRPLGRI